MPDITERMENQMEGTNLALAAVAEILQKMDGRFSKEEQDIVAQQQSDAQVSARADLVKSIANEVLTVIKGEGADMGLDVDPKERKAKSTGGTPQNADDSESSVTPTTKIEDQQNTIQAMQKQLNAIKKEYEEENGQEKEKEEDRTEKGGMAYKQEDEDEIPEESAEEPVVEEEEEEEEEEVKAYKGGMAKQEEEEEADEEAADEPVLEEKGEDMEEEEVEDEDEEASMKSMQKQIRSLKKDLKASKTGMQKAVQTEAEDRLRKMGFREETSLQAPKVMNNSLGIEDLTPIAKAEGDIAGQLVDMSYQELRRLQQKIDTGETDGLPRELIGN